MFDEAYDRARETVTRRSLDDPAVQSKIALYVIGAKTANISFLSVLDQLPVRSTPGSAASQHFIHDQLFRETALMTEFHQTFQWTLDPWIYYQSGIVLAPITMTFAALGGPSASLLGSTNFYRGLALGHAILSSLRLTPILPANPDLLDRRVIAINRLDSENGPMIQTQIHLLRNCVPELDENAKETLIQQQRQAVIQSFSQFLDWLAE
jgi:hypothetical protein